MNWRKYYKMPLRLDDWGHMVWDSKNTHALDFNDKTTTEYMQEQIVDAINEKGGYRISNLYVEDGVDFYKDGEYIFCVRGWGYLTGTCNLPSEKAAKVQDEFVDFIFEKLTKP